MAIYDGNHLPESPTAMLQMAVLVVYTLLVFLLMGYGAIAVLAAQNTISSELQAQEYMRRLVRKHNAVVRGMIAFIPATFSLAHLYTSSLHNGSLYSASNVLYLDVFGFATSHLGGAMQQVVADSNHMDSTKAVYELLYFLNRCCAKLSSEKAPKPLLRCMSNKDGCNETFASKAWRFPWVLFNCFLAIASLDDSRIWGQFLAWIRRRRKPSTLDRTPPPGSNSFCSVFHCIFASWGCYPFGCAGYAYWLFSQDGNVYNYTGSVIVEQAIPEKLSIASYSTREMYPAAQRFLAEMSQHFQRAINRATNMTFRIRCSVGDGILKASDLRECLSRVRFENQDLNMAVERYICRSTPDYAALSLPAGPVVTDIIKVV